MGWPGTGWPITVVRASGGAPIGPKLAGLSTADSDTGVAGAAAVTCSASRGVPAPATDPSTVVFPPGGPPPDTPAPPSGPAIDQPAGSAASRSGAATEVSPAGSSGLAARAVRSASLAWSQLVNRRSTAGSASRRSTAATGGGTPSGSGSATVQSVWMWNSAELLTCTSRRPASSSAASTPTANRSVAGAGGRPSRYSGAR